MLVLLAQDGLPRPPRCDDPARPGVARDPLLPGHIELHVAGARHGEDAAQGRPGDGVRVDADRAAVGCETDGTVLTHIGSHGREPGPGRERSRPSSPELATLWRPWPRRTL